MPPSRPSITLDKDAYYPGDTVTGSVMLENVEPLVARSMKISWRGKSQTWGISITDPGCVKYSFRKGQMIWVSKNGKNQMPAQTFIHDFSFTIPADCPPTFHGEYGKNDCKVKVEIDRPWKLPMEEVKEFVVTKKVELPEQLRAYGPSSQYIGNFRSGLIFSRGPITLKVHIANKTYHPGESFNIKFCITNNSGAHVNRVFADLFQHAHYHSHPQLKACEDFEGKLCPSSNRCQKKTEKRLCISYFPVNVKPYNEEIYHMTFTIPADKANIPSFETQLMTFGYTIGCGVCVKDSFWRFPITSKIYIGDIEEKSEGLITKPVPPPLRFGFIKNFDSKLQN